jgi:hypothetical protein
MKLGGLMAISAIKQNKTKSEFAQISAYLSETPIILEEDDGFVYLMVRHIMYKGLFVFTNLTTGKCLVGGSSDDLIRHLGSRRFKYFTSKITLENS